MNVRRCFSVLSAGNTSFLFTSVWQSLIWSPGHEKHDWNESQDLMWEGREREDSFLPVVFRFLFLDVGDMREIWVTERQSAWSSLPNQEFVLTFIPFIPDVCYWMLRIPGQRTYVRRRRARTFRSPLTGHLLKKKRKSFILFQSCVFHFRFRSLPRDLLLLFPSLMLQVQVHRKGWRSLLSA